MGSEEEEEEEEEENKQGGEGEIRENAQRFSLEIQIQIQKFVPFKVGSEAFNILCFFSLSFFLNFYSISFLPHPTSQGRK